MGDRGRKSAAELSLASANGVVKRAERAEPPSELTAEQRAEWMTVVNANAADRFTEAQLPMLAAHCRHVVAQRRIGQLIADLERQDDIDIGDYDRLLKMQERESRCLSSLAVRLGFAYSTSYEKRPPKGGTVTKAPWEK